MRYIYCCVILVTSMIAIGSIVWAVAGDSAEPKGTITPLDQASLTTVGTMKARAGEPVSQEDHSVR